MSDSMYWASKPAEQVTQDIWQRIQRWGEHVQKTNKLKLWLNALTEYYAGDESSGETGVAGDQDEITTVKVNDLHSIGEKIVVAITAQPPHFEPKATNSDHKSMRQAIFATGILETARREKGLDDADVIMTRMAYLSGEAFSTTLWDQEIGDDLAADPETGAIAKKGDLQYRTYHPLDVVRDYLKSSSSEHQWYVFRDWANRWDLIAQHGVDDATRSKLLSLPAKEQVNNEYPMLIAIEENDPSDDVAVYTFVHDVTPSMPQGRMIRLCSAQVVLSDGPLPAEKLKDIVQRLAPEEKVGTERGYTAARDLLPLAHCQNSAVSMMLTTNSTFGGQGVWTKPDGGLTTEYLVGKFLHMQCAEKPEPFSLIDPRATAEAEKFAGYMGNAMERISGVNAVSRGSPEALIKGGASGAALALLDAKTLESIRGLQKGRVSWLTSIATATIRQFRKNATTPRSLLVLGKANRNFLRDVTGEDVSGIERVLVDLGNPLAQTISGRMQILDTLMKVVDAQGVSVIKTPEHVFEVLTTGRLEPAIEADLAETLNIRAENEAIGEGQPVSAAFTDHHPMHMREHRSLLASPESRQDPALIQAVSEHMNEHAMLWRTTDPAILMALGIPPPPPPPMPPGMPPVGAPPGPGGPAAPGGPGQGMPEPQGAESELPSMPTNPATGEKAPAPMPPTA